MLSILFSVIVGATDAPVDISNCTHLREFRFITCDIHNSGPKAISEIRFDAVARDANREIPWAEAEGHRQFGIQVSGGIEPGETLEVNLRVPDVPKRAEDETLIFDLIGLVALDKDGEAIKTPSTPAPAP